MEVREASADYLPTAAPRVPVGYKQTGVGVIPEDWHLISFIGAVGAYIDYRGRTPRKLGLSWGGGDILALSANNVQMGNINPDKEAYLGNEDLYRKWMVQGECEQDDILLTMEAPLGNVAQIPDSRKYILSQRVLLIKPKEWVLRDFLAHYMRGSYFQKQLDLNSTGSTAKGIQRKKLDEIPVYIPPTKAEQEAIAEALNDADALIESLEHLLVKKRQLKQGAMQELLTGKRRLPGFSGEWGVKPLDALGRWTGGMTPSMQNLDYWQPGAVPWVSSGDVKSARLHSTAFAVSEYAIKQKATTLVPENSIIMVTRSGILRKYLPVAMSMVPMAINQDIKALLPNSQLVPDFVFHSLSSNGDRILARCLKSGTTVESIEFSWLKAFTIRLPRPPEQTAIATILSDMDAELAALEERLAKARAIKQGMMQELLTGRIRLIEPHHEVGTNKC